MSSPVAPRRPSALFFIAMMVSVVLRIEGFDLGIECVGVDQCNMKYSDLSFANDKCQLLSQVEDCLDALDSGGCYSNFLYLYLKGEVITGKETYNCSSTDTTPEPTDPVDECEPKLTPPDDSNIEIKDVSIPEINPTESLTKVLCSQHYYPALRHCSIFSYSHLRPFGVEDIETCSLPGTWYLLNHPDVTIEVTGVPDGIKPLSTKISKVNITLYSFKCTAGASISYTASLDEDHLASTFTSDEYVKVKVFDVVDFHINRDRSVASIIAPWLNLTIIVTKQDDNLGVVLRMPLNLANNADGLCSSQCPSHSLMETEDEFCYHDKNTAILSCAQNAGLLQSSSSLPKFFVDACQYDVLHSMSYSVLSFIKTISKQYPLLPNVGPNIPPSPPDEFGSLVINPATTTTTLPLPMSASRGAGSSIADQVKITSSSVTTQSIGNVGPSVTNSQNNRGNGLPVPTNLPLDQLPSSSSALQPNRLLVILVIALLPLFLLFRS